MKDRSRALSVTRAVRCSGSAADTVHHGPYHEYRGVSVSLGLSCLDREHCVVCTNVTAPAMHSLPPQISTCYIYLFMFIHLHKITF